MFKNGILTIDYDTWKTGIASSPLVGCGMVRNADVLSQRGAFLCGFKAVKESGTTVTDFVRFMDYAEDGDQVFAGDDSGNLYRRSGDGLWSLETDFNDASECHGLVFWKGHVLFAEQETLSVFNPSGGLGGEEEDAWQTFQEGSRNAVDLPHPMHVGQDDVVYIGDGRYIASLQEEAGQTFDPDDSNTYTWNAQALDLPDGYVVETLSEIGTYLLIGTKFTAPTNRGNRAYSFPWDRISASFNVPLRVKGNGAWQSIEKDNVVYSLVDRNNGKIYASNLTAIEMQREIRTIGTELDLHPDAIDILEEEILFGIGSNNAASENLGVYSLREGVLQLRNVVSGGDAAVEIGSILNVGDGEFLVSWSDGTNHGVDVVSTTRCTDYATVLETPMFTVGTTLEPHPFTQIDVNLAKKLATGQGVRVKYREHLDDDWTEIGTFDFATFGAVAHVNSEAKTGDVTTIQVRVELTAASSSTDSPELLSVSLS